MDIRREFEKRIEKKRLEIMELELKIAEARAYSQALMDTLKILPKDDASPEEPTSNLRPGSDLALAADLIKEAGKPLHIDQILTGIGKPITKENKASLGTSLSAYARRTLIFTRPLPNTFGLIGQADTGAGATNVPPAVVEEDDEVPF
jgi:hypothetical protein